jgi:multimeric flavodoxin WrbA
VRVLGVVGSARKERGLTDQLVRRALQGAAARGAQTDVIYLADRGLQPCIGCGGGCFRDEVCRQDRAATQLSAEVDAYDALVLGAPVYTWRQNALTAIFQDKLRLPTGSLITGSLPGKPALGIAVAGGTGSGVMGALQSIYRWLAVWAYRALGPIPVTRYNLAAALEVAEASGQRLADEAALPRPFADVAECLLHYDSFPFLSYGYADEFLWLARQLDADLPAEPAADPVRALRVGLAAAEAALARGDRAEATRLVAPAYLAGRQAWLGLHQ